MEKSFHRAYLQLLVSLHLLFNDGQELVTLSMEHGHLFLASSSHVSLARTHKIRWVM